jgi:hypothetical protein
MVVERAADILVALDLQQALVLLVEQVDLVVEVPMVPQVLPALLGKVTHPGLVPIFPSMEVAVVALAVQDQA